MAAVKSFAQSEPAQLEGLAHLEIGVHIPTGLATYPSKQEVRVIWGEEAALAVLINVLTDLDGWAEKPPQDTGNEQAVVRAFFVTVCLLKLFGLGAFSHV